ncbi:MAG: GntR family transcriptional regulator [Boseongicola sp. SB0673_bin_14]|nr:GntR family transcriptional regulator [Boseongicola sp. SB0667_bin_21]MYI70847.1 GntR family transcriptional regulator [Boseongicola sp. SB0673_bin_14]
MKAATAIHVPELTPDQFREIQRIGFLLEGEAAEVAAQKITPQQLKSLEDIQKQLVEAARGNPTRAARLNRRFHCNLMAVADMPLVHATVENMWALKGPILRIYQLEALGKAAMEQHAHYDVLDGLRNGDGGKAREAIQRDIAGCNDMIAWIKERQKETEEA